MPHKILVVDDDADILKLARGYLEQDGFSVAEARDGPSALELIRRSRPDLVVLDLMIPGLDGFGVLRTLRADRALAPIPVILLTARLDESDKVLGLELGADDYVTKPFSGRELAARAKAVLRRGPGSAAAQEAAILSAGALNLDLRRRTASVEGREIILTKTEFSILEALMANPGYTLTRDELLEKALGYSWEGMGRTLDSHIRNLRKKIEADPDDPRTIETVYGVGYRIAGAGR